MLENSRILVMILYNEFEPLQWFQDFFKIGWRKWKWKCDHKQNSRIARNSRDQKSIVV